MSLNGLDEAKIQEAYNAAIAELGGWFILKYTSRDEVDILDQGTGGIVEVRSAIAKYEEQSPLFGFLRYRRRSVLLKYVPDGCSRLVIARLTVHFSAITEKFPHDIVFSIETATELKDSKLSAACSSHKASASTSSSTSSLRRRRLMEINEDEEDEEDEHRAKRQSTVQEERAANANADQLFTTTNEAAQSEPPMNPARPDLMRSTSYQSHVTENESKAETSRTYPERSKSPTRDLETRRTSSSSSRPDMYKFSSAGSGYKPKVKLGPRPSLDSNARSRGTGSSSQFRPISTLPAGLKLFGRGSKKGRERPQSQYPVAPPNMTTSSFNPSNDETTSSLANNSRTRTSGSRPNTSSGASVRPMASPTASLFSTASRTSTITPEKARLMKALELRKKQLAKPPTQQLPPTPVEDQHPTDTNPESSDSIDDIDSGATENQNELSLNITSDSPISKIATSDLTRTDSSPPSPAGTERAASTKASSISESADETVPATRKEELVDEGIIVGPQVYDTEPAHSSVETKNEPSSNGVPVEEDEVILEPDKDVGTPTVVVIEQTGLSRIEESAPLPDIREETEGAEEIEPAATSTALPPSPLETTPVAETASIQLPVMSKTAMQEETVPANTEVRELKVPTSKFSMQNLREDPELTESETPELIEKVVETPEEFINTEPEPVVSPVTVENLEELNAAQGLKKRQSTIAAIRADLATPDLSVANSEIDFDDDLMDELQAATVQEAQPIHVSKSPIASVFPSTTKQRYGDSKRASISSTRNFSSPLENSSAPFLAPEAASRPSTARSVSAASKYLERVNSQQSAPLAKKVNVGGGIAQRIKALEKLQGAAPTSGVTTINTPPAASAAFFSVRKVSGREGTSPPLSRDNSSTDFNKLRGRRSSSIASQRESFSNIESEQQPQAVSRHTTGDSAQGNNAQQLLSDSSPTGETVRERRSSLTVVKELISPRRASFAFNQRAETMDPKDNSQRPSSSSPAASRPPSSRRSSRELSRNTVLSSLSGNTVLPSTNEDLTKPSSSSSNNKSSMTTRMLRRMSSSLSNSHKNVATSPTLLEDAEPSSTPDGSLSAASSMSNIVFDLGDVNVQFPDTLLWKRRTLRLDTSGNMILNATQGTKENLKAGVTKKYHMSEFTRPHEPDFDAQELPNSVALDFLAGGGLQFACEDRAGQTKVLSVLQDSHKTWFGKSP